LGLSEDLVDLPHCDDAFSLGSCKYVTMPAAQRTFIG
jgi:hypothetical protein